MVCSKCGINYPRTKEFFIPCKGYTDGLTRWCRKCSAKNRNKWRKENMFRENHTPAAIERRKRYKKSIKGKVSANKYSKNHPEVEWRKGKMWRLKHPEQVAHSKRIRRERMNGVLKTLTFNEWEDILKNFEYECVYCGRKEKITLDHLVPITKGGDHTKDNVVPACLSCNASKNNKLLEDWLKIGI
jgi:5-methylcytosine-specific restriction endonuclease McrA